MTLTNLTGAAGMLIVLLAFLLTQFRLWKGDYLIYEFCNFFGSLLLVIYSVLLGSVPFILLNAVWGAVAFWYFVEDLRRNAHRGNHRWLHRRTFFEKWME